MNRGAQILSAKLVRGDQHRLAEELGIDQGYLSRIVRGERVPGLATRKLFLERFEIDLLDWDEDPRPEPIPPEPETAQTDHGFDGGRRAKPRFVDDSDPAPETPDAA